MCHRTLVWNTVLNNLPFKLCGQTQQWWFLRLCSSLCTYRYVNVIPLFQNLVLHYKVYRSIKKQPSFGSEFCVYSHKFPNIPVNTIPAMYSSNLNKNKFTILNFDVIVCLHRQKIGRSQTNLQRRSNMFSRCFRLCLR